MRNTNNHACVEDLRVSIGKSILMCTGKSSQKSEREVPDLSASNSIRESKIYDEPFDEVLVDECASKACFRLMRLSNKKNASLIINNKSESVSCSDKGMHS